jgi:hypothetical protein
MRLDPLNEAPALKAGAFFVFHRPFPAGDQHKIRFRSDFLFLDPRVMHSFWQQYAGD